MFTPGKTLTAAAAALVLTTGMSMQAEARGSGGAIAAGVIGGIALGALATSAARSNNVYRAPPAYHYDAPGGSYGPSYRPRYGVLYSPTENQAIEACRRGLLVVARRYGAFDARLNDVDYIDRTPNGGYRLQVEITMFYPNAQRESEVVCNTKNGALLNAQAIN